MLCAPRTMMNALQMRRGRLLVIRVLCEEDTACPITGHNTQSYGLQCLERIQPNSPLVFCLAGSQEINKHHGEFNQARSQQTRLQASTLICVMFLFSTIEFPTSGRIAWSEWRTNEADMQFHVSSTSGRLATLRAIEMPKPAVKSDFKIYDFQSQCQHLAQWWQSKGLQRGI